MLETKLAQTTLLDAFVHDYDVLESGEVEVSATLSETYAAIWKTDLREPILAALFAVPGPASRMARRLAGLAESPRPGDVTFGRIVAGGRGWQRLAATQDRELVLGTVTRFWRKDRPTRAIDPEAFREFGEPGWVKVALSFSVERVTEDRTILRYEGRVAATDDGARRRFRRHWRVIRAGVIVALRRSAARIRTEAEWAGTLAGALSDR